MNAFYDDRKRRPLDWPKGYAASSPLFCGIGSLPVLVEMVTQLLGEDFLLWGASVLTRQPGEVHPWHTDIETADAAGGTVTVWIGLENTHRDSSLLLIPQSHRFGVSVQEIRHRRGSNRSETTTEEVLRWARERDERCRLVTPEMADGEALFLDGRIWHGSNNLFSATRRALLLQYAAPSVPIRMPDPKNFDWPFQRINHPKPPCVMIRGSDYFGVNRIVARPDADGRGTLPPLDACVRPLSLPLLAEDASGWKPYSLFKGSTPGMDHFSCHVSALNHGCSPHPPHRHDDEEILILLKGEVDLLLPDLPSANGAQRKRLTAGEFVFYPAQFAHSLETVSPQPANYLMFKWRNSSGHRSRSDALSFGRFKLSDHSNFPAGANGFHCARVLEGTTGWLRTLQGHLSRLAPGAGYDPHSDPYDVAMILLEGELESLGQRLNPHSVIFHPASQPHGLRNPGTDPAVYWSSNFTAALELPASRRRHYRAGFPPNWRTATIGGNDSGPSPGRSANE